jgi:HEAT repeat protein
MFIRARAVWALGQVRNPLERSAAIAAVHAKLNDPAWLVRQFALRALKRLKDPELGVVARRMTQDPDENVRELARELLEEDGRR